MRSALASNVLAAALLGGCGSQEQPALPSVATQHVQRAPALQALYSFTGGDDGEVPVSGVVALQHPKRYPQVIGTTELGGSNQAGTVYGLMKSKNTWNEQTLYEMKGSDGWEPIGIAVPKSLSAATPVFITSFRGGANADGAFTVLQPNANGSWTAQSSYSFKGQPDGAAPMGAVIEDANGNIYGTTCGGGAHNFGTVYRMQRNGSGYSESILYSFLSGTDGDCPRGHLVDVGGVLYGTTESGGGSREAGTIFKLTPSASGYVESVVYAFRGAPDGAEPYSGLCIGSNGALYGTTVEGGAYNYGTAYKFAPTSAALGESVLWSFGGFVGDGLAPYGSVILDGDGVIYGTTINSQVTSGTSSGTMFTLTPKGGAHKEKVYDFSFTNGAAPEAGPTADGRGNIYMSTAGGGSHFDGVVAAAKGAARSIDCDPDSTTYSE